MCCRGEFWGMLHCAADLFSFVAQLGDGSTSGRLTPVAVVGLSSGVAMVALGAVRLIATAAWLLLVCERCRCVFDLLERCEETRGVCDVMFAVSLLCAVELRRGVVLGTE